MVGTGAPRTTIIGFPGHTLLLAACFALAATLLSCGGGDHDRMTEDRLLSLEAKAHSREEAIGALADENARLKSELAALQEQQASFVQSPKASTPIREYREEEVEYEKGQEQLLAALEEGHVRSSQRLEDLEVQVAGVEDDMAELGDILPLMETWLAKQDKNTVIVEETALDRTRQIAEAAGGEVYNIDSREQEERAILVLPLQPIEGAPLILSLHGYGGNSADHSLYVPLHEHVNSRGFGLLLPNGTPDGDGNPSWNPTHQATDGAKASADDYAYLSGLVARVKELKDFGPVYIFGYSNGGFMAYHMACNGLPGLRAVASLAGTSYYKDSECEGAPPVSVLHVHSMGDPVIRFHGSEESQLPALTAHESYVGAKDMFYRWGQRAGCDLDSTKDGEQLLDLDAYVEGAETFTYRFTDGCAEGITVEMWSSDEGGHTPGYGDTFMSALLDWLLSQD